MSYCRFSSDNWKSDVYVYANVNGGWTTHVAANRTVGDPPEEADLTQVNIDDGSWLASHKAAMAFLDAAERLPIGLPHDGASFCDATPGECADRLKALRAEGYHVPQYAIDDLEDDQSAIDAEQSA